VVDAGESKKGPKVTIHPSVKVQLRSSLRKNWQDPKVTSKRLEEVAKRLLVKQAKVTSEPENLFDMDGDVQEALSGVVTEETLQKPTKNDSAELLRYHYKFGHVSFVRLQAMVKQGTLAAKLAKCPLPVCASCFYGKATKRATGTKTPISILL
jgi:GAG-pre-integrase domain